MRTEIRAGLSLLLAGALAYLLAQPPGSVGKVGPLSPAGLVLVVVFAGAVAAVLRSVGRPAWGVLLAGVAGGLAGGALHSPRGAIMGLVVGGFVASVPLPRRARAHLDGRGGTLRR